MGNEISLTASLSCFKPSVMGSVMGRSVTGQLATMTANPFIEGTVLVTTAAMLIPLGQVTAPHWAWFKNLDAGNFINLRNGASGAVLLKLLAGEACPLPLDDSSIPYAQANTAACLMEYLVFSL